ncbi:TonB-dependent receptor plug domain-containing protein [Massilia phosphatilytica]
MTEVLQRVVGVTIDRTMSKGDPEHYSVEGSGVTVRGLSYVRSELNGRDSFSANGGRSLNFEDVPPELMAGVDVYKNPSAEQIEGAVGGLVNLRTALPFDFKGRKMAASLEDTYSELKRGKRQPSALRSCSRTAGRPASARSARWSTSRIRKAAPAPTPSRSNRTTRAATSSPARPCGCRRARNGARWNFDRKREGTYGALQWKKDSTLSSSLTFFKSRYKMHWDEQAIFAQSSPYNIQVGTDATFDSKGAAADRHA